MYRPAQRSFLGGLEARSFVPFVVIVLSLLIPGAVAAQEGVDNRVHPPGTETAPLGELGHVERRGTGPVDLLLVPGASFGWSVWEGFMERNADRYTMWAVTPAGYDGTPPPPMPEGYPLDERPWSDALVDGLADLVREEGMEQPIVVGHHILGDYYAMRLGLEHPELVGGVVVMAGLPTRPQQVRGEAGPRSATAEEKVAAARDQLLPMMQSSTPEQWRESSMSADQLSKDPERARRLWERQVGNPIPTQLRYFMEWSGSKLTDRLGGLDDPMLVVFPQRWHTFDEAIEANMETRAFQQRFETAERAREALLAGGATPEEGLARLTSLAQWTSLADPPEDYRVEPVKGSGIFVMMDRPEATDRILSEWIREVRSHE